MDPVPPSSRQGPAGGGSGAAVNLETELTCSICADLLYQPLTLLDCLHTFCGACVKEWFSWQAIRAENAPAPPAPDVAVFTCPSCREPVRDTKHDARVTTLLDMFLALNPDKGKSAAEREEMDDKYKKGEKVLPRLSFMDRTPEQRRMDDEERRLLAQVQQMSLREAVAEAAAADSSSHSRSAGGRRRRDRSSRDASREPTGGSGDGREMESSRRRAHSATLQTESAADERRRRRRSESRQRSGDELSSGEQRRQQRRVEHQSSLRSLINTDGLDARDLEREIEDFARQIQEEGLLDGLDLDNIDLTNNDELSRKITEAYRRRHRERARQDHHGGRRSNASSLSYRSDLSATTRPRSRTRDNNTSRPTSRHSAHSRAPSASSNEERGRYPPSSSALLEVQEPSRRRRTPSAGRSATVPIGPTQVPDIRAGVRSQTDLSARANAGAEQHPTRPGVSTVGGGGRSSSSPTAVTSTGRITESPDLRGLPFSARAASGLGISNPPQHQAQAVEQPASSADPPAGTTRKRPGRPLELALEAAVSANFSPTSGPLSPGLASPPLSSPKRSRLPLYREPFITCNGCGREHIEYELHYNCAVCRNGDWNICLDCWRRRKGCLYWFGFGHSAWERWELLRAQAQDKTIAPPHMLRASRYLPPKQIPGGAEGRRTLTTEDPSDRLQSGTFCCRCAAWTNHCYWRCEVCNEGDWGFCNDCVNKGWICTHPLLPLSYQPILTTPTTPTSIRGGETTSPPSSPRSPGAAGNSSRSPARSPVRPPPPEATILTRPNSVAMGDFRPLTFAPPCEMCRKAIPPRESRYHCNLCPSSSSSASEAAEAVAPRPGEYNLCEGCYASLVASGVVSAENGPGGWRRCPSSGDHRMVVVKFVVDPRNLAERRVIEKERLGGRRLEFEPFDVPGLQVCRWWNYTRGEDGKPKKERQEMLITLNVGESVKAIAGGAEQADRWTDAWPMPMGGGSGPSATARWSWYPAAGVEDELMFPKGAEIVEIQWVNEEWFHGFYMGARGLFPAPYVRVSGRDVGMVDADEA